MQPVSTGWLSLTLQVPRRGGEVVRVHAAVLHLVEAVGDLERVPAAAAAVAARALLDLLQPLLRRRVLRVKVQG